MKQKTFFAFAIIILLLFLTCCSTDNDQLFFGSRPEGMDSTIYSNNNFEVAGNGEYYAVIHSKTGSYYVMKYKNEGNTHTYNYILLESKSGGSKGHEVYEFRWKDDYFSYDSYTQILTGNKIPAPLVLHYSRYCYFPGQMHSIWIMDQLNESFNIYDYTYKK